MESRISEMGDRVRRIRDRIAAAALRAGRPAEAVRLVAAAKAQPVELVRAAVMLGIGDIGENYVQEAVDARASVDTRICWHLIGRLQSNKVRRAVELFDVIHSIDRGALGAAISRAAAASGKRVSVLVQVNIGNEASKGGAAPDALDEVLAGLRELPAISVDGLMAIPPLGSPEATRIQFREMERLRARHRLRELSMGMSDDFEIAVEEGATMVRLGRILFGPRP